MMGVVEALDQHDRRVKSTHLAILEVGQHAPLAVAVPEERELRRWMGSPSPVLSLNVVERRRGALVITLESRFTLAGTHLAQLYRDHHVEGKGWSVRLMEPGDVVLPEWDR